MSKKIIEPCDSCFHAKVCDAGYVADNYDSEGNVVSCSHYFSTCMQCRNRVKKNGRYVCDWGLKPSTYFFCSHWLPIDYEFKEI